MREERICRSCKNKFEAKKYKQWYCSKRCFKKDYFQRVNKKEYGMPSFICEVCGATWKLQTDPISDPLFWTNFKCPNCFPETRVNLIIILTSKKTWVMF